MLLASPPYYYEEQKDAGSEGRLDRNSPVPLCKMCPLTHSFKSNMYMSKCASSVLTSTTVVPVSHYSALEEFHESFSFTSSPPPPVSSILPLSSLRLCLLLCFPFYSLRETACNREPIFYWGETQRQEVDASFAALQASRAPSSLFSPSILQTKAFTGK
jgi:hypothetical protein